MPKLTPGDTVTIEATVTRVSDDGAEVTVRLPHYGYPVTLPVGAVALKAKSANAALPDPDEPKAPPLPKRRRSKLSKLLGD